MSSNTARILAGMTDEGEFERLAMAVLRRAEVSYRALSHPGVNVNGRTVRSPVDGIAFVPGVIPPHMIVAHHTICSTAELRRKWLNDPTTVQPSEKSGRATATAGDLVKTASIVKEERERTPALQTTLILTTNREPGESLVRDVSAAGAKSGIAIDIWSGSRLVDFLDNEPGGQWLRKQFLGIDQVQLSEELLSLLSQTSLDLSRPPDGPAAWVDRAIDRAIEEADGQRTVFVIGESGSGKTVACYKRLLANTMRGGFSLVLPDDVIGSSVSLEHAVETTLTRLHPTLMAGCGSRAFRLAKPNQPLIIAVEDINRSGRGANLIEKLARWGNDQTKTGGAASWLLLCPVWPQLMSSLSDEARRRIGGQLIIGGAFSANEGTEAVRRRGALTGRSVTLLQAAAISDALGHDPLLIALHDTATAPDTTKTIEQFVETSLQRLATERADISAAEYKVALFQLAKAMLLQRQMEPLWIDMIAWPVLSPHVAALRHLIHQGEVARLAGPSAFQKLAFRHDRVREWLLADAALELIRANEMPSEIAAEPYYAEIYGNVLGRHEMTATEVSFLASLNPLALFCSVRHFGGYESSTHKAIIDGLEAWLIESSGQDRRHRLVRWEAMEALSEAENPNVLRLIERMDKNSWHALRARYRNGDLMGGIGLALQLEPGVSVAGHDAFIEHVKLRLGDSLTIGLGKVLENEALDDSTRIGALRLAGHIGEPALANAIRACWRNNQTRNNYLGEYLWACAECVDGDPETLLGPVCDAWAALPDTRVEGTGMPSPRESIVAFSLKNAFLRRLPAATVRYFVERGLRPELKSPITHLFDKMDHPDAVDFFVNEVAVHDERLEGTGSFSILGSFLGANWERYQEQTGRPLSDASRQRLLAIWQNPASGRYLRKPAFDVWASVQRPNDIEVLRGVPSHDLLADKVLWARLKRCDVEAIPLLTEKLSSDQSGYWWQLGRYIWSDALTIELDKALAARAYELSEDRERENRNSNVDWILSEMLTRLPTKDAETLIIRYWDRLCLLPDYVIAAMYAATKELRGRVSKVMKAVPEPKEFLRHLSTKFGHKTNNHRGIYRKEQIEFLIPYLDFVNKSDIYSLWDACNEHRWFDLRRDNLDFRLEEANFAWNFLDEKRAMNYFDEFAVQNSPSIHYWCDAFLKSGASLDDVMTLVAQWLYGKKTCEALELASRAVLHVGERRHVKLLEAAKVEPADIAASIIADTEFGVSRRSLI